MELSRVRLRLSRWPWPAVLCYVPYAASVVQVALCATEVQRICGVPEDTPCIDVVLHADRPEGKCVELSDLDRCYGAVAIEGRMTHLYLSAHDWLAEHMPESGKCWLAIEYDD